MLMCVCVLCSIWLWTLNWCWEVITDMHCHPKNTSLRLWICILTLSTCSCLFCQLLDMHEATDVLKLSGILGCMHGVLFWYWFVLCALWVFGICCVVYFLVFNTLICIYNIYYLCQRCQCVQLLCLSVCLSVCNEITQKFVDNCIEMFCRGVMCVRQQLTRCRQWSRSQRRFTNFHPCRIDAVVLI